jgi:translation initiation factor 2B subunit (eIF-2B alpha/beta/delta family)
VDENRERLEKLNGDSATVVKMLTDRINVLETNLTRSIESNKKDLDADISRVESRLEELIRTNNVTHEDLHDRINRLGDKSNEAGMNRWERIAWGALAFASAMTVWALTG